MFGQPLVKGEDLLSLSPSASARHGLRERTLRRSLPASLCSADQSSAPCGCGLLPYRLVPAIVTLGVPIHPHPSPSPVSGSGNQRLSSPSGLADTLGRGLLPYRLVPDTAAFVQYVRISLFPSSLFSPTPPSVLRLSAMDWVLGPMARPVASPSWCRSLSDACPIVCHFDELIASMHAGQSYHRFKFFKTYYFLKLEYVSLFQSCTRESEAVAAAGAIQINLGHLVFMNGITISLTDVIGKEYDPMRTIETSAHLADRLDACKSIFPGTGTRRSTVGLVSLRLINPQDPCPGVQFCSGLAAQSVDL
ncbi:hypothetical protein DFH06DRAFT_1325329 [Mycena polygramma]|nr:hypothetical protein DFH06DRAFT_1325329 [Mycena polygramma]